MVKPNFDDMPELPMCKHCGRVVLAGWCCRKALEEAAELSKKARQAKKKKGALPPRNP